MLNVLRIITHIAILYCIYLIGDWIQVSLNLFIPGSVIGMLILFTLLMTKVIKVKWIEDGTALIIKYLPFIFVPATVGVINYLDLFSGSGFLLVIITLVSTVLVMAGSGLMSQWLVSRKE